MSDWNIIPIAGDYDVTISFNHGAQLDSGQQLSLQPVNLKLKVTNSDAPLLQSECNLAKSLFLGARDSTEASNAANLLSKFNDVSALECLSQAYYSRSPYHFEYALIHAIGAMNAEAARKILTNIANGNRKEDAAIAKGELQRMKDR